MDAAEREKVATAPVFVDASGRRRRGLSVLGYLGASASVAYLAAFGLTVTSTGGTIDAATGVPLTPSPLIDEGDDDDGGVDVPADTVVAATPAHPRVTDAAVTRPAARHASRSETPRHAATSSETPRHAATSSGRPRHRPASSVRHRAAEPTAAPVVHRVTRSSLVAVRVVTHTSRPVVVSSPTGGHHRVWDDLDTHRQRHHHRHHAPRHAAPTAAGTHTTTSSGGSSLGAAGSDILPMGA
ncbi:hypothetical protein Acsp06_31590 [Actinomycetospora sp. NBRC 106375]|uniref:hypothetical protein n=1 Tax=Actinomycetospora sp. NBRC 106375 TaxID=3032207 RepID=UPI00249FF785|nr:hypothetical protein [Actinomycetospora sp. NBRC 106375]GLZ46974.1 hypothetical protein Acsp06_31590 [Actinomycetospora sp. NBRC 106375]